MRNLSITLTLIGMSAALLTTTGCASKQKRTKWTDPVMRVMIDPQSVDATDYVSIQYALHATGKWIIVDRNDGYEAIVKEQERIHRDMVDRFADREKYAHWGKLYGVGGVVVGHRRCVRKQTMILGSDYRDCRVHLAIINANTGEVLSAASGKERLDGWDSTPTFEEVADTVTDQFPKHFEPNKNAESLERYKDISKEEAIRQKEQKAREELGHE